MKTRWLKENEYLSAWLQTVGVITALIFGAIQLRDARIAVEAGVEANNIELTNRVTDLLTRINEAALDHPEVAGEHTGVSRLHLMRLEYFLQIHNLKTKGIIDTDRFQAETRYLAWVGEQAEFSEVWKVFGNQYPTPFRKWVDRTIDRSTASL